MNFEIDTKYEVGDKVAVKSSGLVGVITGIRISAVNNGKYTWASALEYYVRIGKHESVFTEGQLIHVR